MRASEIKCKNICGDACGSKNNSSEYWTKRLILKLFNIKYIYKYTDIYVDMVKDWRLSFKCNCTERQSIAVLRRNNYLYFSLTFITAPIDIYKYYDNNYNDKDNNECVHFDRSDGFRASLGKFITGYD